MISAVTLVIRYAGERTLNQCRQLITAQGVSESQIFVVEEAPFSAAMRASFEIGIREARPWTFCLDADVLLRPDSISNLLLEAAKKPENVCELQGLVLDKFFGGPRPAGNHLYRTSLLPEVLQRIPPEGTDIRPEYHTLQAMRADGFPWLQIPYIVGLHDDQQYYRDIYRKCMVQGVKHLYLADLFIPLWKRNMKTDPDFQVALHAFADSIKSPTQLYIDKNQDVYTTGFDHIAIQEKDALEANYFQLTNIETIVSGWEDAPEYQKYFSDRFGLITPVVTASVTKTRFQTFREIIREKGWVYGLINTLGMFFDSIGKYLIKKTA